MRALPADLFQIKKIARAKVQRLFLRGREYRYQTRAEPMPRHHQEWKKAQGYDAAYFLEQARLLGPATHWAMQSWTGSFQGLIVSN